MQRCDGCRGLPSPTRCNTPLVSGTDEPLQKPDKTRREKGGQTNFTTPAKENNKPGHGTHANAKRSSKGNQRKKNHRVWTYGCGDIDETVRRGLDMGGIHFQRSKSVLWVSMDENALSSREDILWPAKGQNTPLD